MGAIQARKPAAPPPVTPFRPPAIQRRQPPAAVPNVIQPLVGFEYELGNIKTQRRIRTRPTRWAAHTRGQMIKGKTGYAVTADSGPNGTSQIEFIISPVDETDPVACARAVAAARRIQADIKALAADEHVGKWVPGNQTIHTSASHRFLVEASHDRLVGQLQATAGLSIALLPEVVSGRAVARLPATNRARSILGNYHERNDQPVWHAARAEARRLGPRDRNRQEVLASVIAMIAQVPLSLHGETPGGQGMFTAKTDFSKILAEAIAYAGLTTIDSQAFETAVINTINTVIRAGLHPENTLTANHGVFPRGYQAAGVRLSGLSIRRWLKSMLPSRTGRQGRDLLTPQNFPGSQEQRDELRAFGRLGNRVDPGNRPLFEFRNLSSVYPQDLDDAVEGVLGYIRSANAPPPVVAAPQPRGWGSYLSDLAVVGGLVALHVLTAPLTLEAT